MTFCDYDFKDVDLNRLDEVIDVLSNVVDDQRFNINYWRDSIDQEVHCPEDFHQCGTTACIAGWARVTRSWIETEGPLRPDDYYSPRYLSENGSIAFGKFLNLPGNSHYEICIPDLNDYVYFWGWDNERLNDYIKDPDKHGATRDEAIELLVRIRERAKKQLKVAPWIY